MPSARAPAAGEQHVQAGCAPPRTPNASGRAPAGRVAGWLLLAAALAVLLYDGREVRPQIDDAYISYQYARNWVEGHGLVFNPGERVEGYTNLLWTLLVAAGVWLGWDAPSVGHALGLTSGIAVLVATYLLAASLIPGRAWLAGVAAWLVLTSIPFGSWAFSGMETPLFTAAVTLTLLAQCRRRVGWATLAVAVATLTRPEGGILAALVFTSHLHDAWREGGLRRGATWVPPALYLALLLAITAFRLAYYGSPVPNTFHAKVGGVSAWWGWLYLWRFLATGAGLLVVPALLAVWREPRARFFALYAAVHTGYVVAIGGDAFPNGRFLLPLLPGSSALATWGVARALERRSPLAAPLLLLLACALLWQLLGPVATPLVLVALAATAAWMLPPRRRPVRLGLAVAAAGFAVIAGATLQLPGFSLGALRDGLREPARVKHVAQLRTRHQFFELHAERRARLLREGQPPVRLVATTAIGALGYFSRLPILDILGLIDPHIAHSAEQASGLVLPGHQRSDADYVLSRRPDYIFVPRAPEPKLILPAVTAIREHPRFQADYAWDPALLGYRLRGDAQGASGPGRAQIGVR